jgi:hypothetical protein
MHVTNENSSSVGIHQRGRLLEQAEQFKDNYDNDNYADYVEYASAHGWTNIKVGVRWLAAIRIK